MLYGLNGHVFTKMLFYARNFRKESRIWNTRTSNFKPLVNPSET